MNMNCGQSRMPQYTPQTPRGELQPPPCGSCVAAPGVPTLAGLPLAMVYAPNQEWREIMCPEDALGHGTLFKELVFPWNMSCCPNAGCARNGGCAND